MADRRSSARVTLDQARYLLRQAALSGLEDREAFGTNLLAAIQFGRNVTWHIQKEYSERQGFASWYEPHRKTMEADALCHFLSSLRNVIVKEGPARIHKVSTMSISLSGGFVVAAKVQVVRDRPWYKRGIKLLWDGFRAGTGPIRRWYRRLDGALRRRMAKRPVPVLVRENLYLDHPTWGSRPAFELVREYLDKLEAVVADAEAQWSE